MEEEDVIQSASTRWLRYIKSVSFRHPSTRETNVSQDGKEKHSPMPPIVTLLPNKRYQLYRPLPDVRSCSSSSVDSEPISDTKYESAT